MTRLVLFELFAVDHQKWQRSVAHISASPGRHGTLLLLLKKNPFFSVFSGVGRQRFFR